MTSKVSTGYITCPGITSPTGEFVLSSASGYVNCDENAIINASLLNFAESVTGTSVGYKFPTYCMMLRGDRANLGYAPTFSVTENSLYVGLNSGSTGVFETPALFTTVVGNGAGVLLTSSSVANTLIGATSGLSLVSGQYNVTVGYNTGANNVSGSFNTYVGTSCGYGNLGSNNTYLGFGSGSGDGAPTNSYTQTVAIGSTSAVGGDRAIAIGHGSNAGATDAIAIGRNASATGASSIAIGNGVTNSTANRILIGTTSDHVVIAGTIRSNQTGDGLRIVQDTNGSAWMSLAATFANGPTFITVPNSTTTSGATVTVIQGITTDTNKVLWMETKVVAKRTGGTAGAVSDCAYFRVTGLYHNNAGVVSLIGSVIKEYIPSTTSWNVNFTISGTTVNVEVTGATNVTIVWQSSTTYNILV